MGLDLWQTFLALFMILAGFVTYYLVPYAFTFRDFQLFLAILLAVLLGMLVGLCILSLAVQPYGERFMVWAMLWGPHKKLRPIVRKNLSGHRSRNRKTAIMFTICIAFIVFAGVMFSLQAVTISDNVKVFFGADLLVTAPDLTEALREDEMSAFLDNEIARRKSGENSVVVDYAFVTFPMAMMELVSNVDVANLPEFPEFSTRLFGLQENYASVVYNEFFVPSEADSSASVPSVNGKDDIIRLMWTDAGNSRLPEERNGVIVPEHVVPLDSDSILTGTPDYIQDMDEAYLEYVDAVVSEALRDWGSIDTNTPLDLAVRQAEFPGVFRTTFHWMAKARGMASKVPGFFFSSYKPTAFFTSTLIREDQFKAILDAFYDRVGLARPEKAPKQRLMVRVTSGATDQQREDVINGLRTYFVTDATWTVDTVDVIESTETAVDMLNLFFTIGRLALACWLC